MGFGKKLGRKFKKFGRSLRKGLPVLTKALGRGAKNLGIGFLGELAGGNMGSLTARGLEKVSNVEVGQRSIGDLLNIAAENNKDIGEIMGQVAPNMATSAVFDKNADPAERTRLLQNIGASQQ